MQKGLSSLNALLVGDRIFRVPIYQRNFSWTRDQLDDLWEDLTNLDAGKKHYFGTVVLRPCPELRPAGLKSFQVFDIIDGQQRITSVLVLLREMIAALENINHPAMAQQLTDMRKDYLKYDGVYKLELLGDDKEFFENRIVEGQRYPNEILTPSQRRLRDSRSYFARRLEEVRLKVSQEEFTSFCVDLKAKIDRLEIITYPAEDDADAVLIFETVNDRGRPLSNLDKTKSFMMHMVYLSSPKGADPSTALRKIEESFGKAYRHIEVTTASPWGENIDEDDVQRYHFVIYEPHAKGEKKIASEYLDYLKEVCRSEYRRNRPSCLTYVGEYVKDLESAFYALKEIVSHAKDDSLRDWLERLFMLRRVANFYPLLVASWIRFHKNLEKIEGILQVLETYAVRVYVVGGRRADAGINQLYSLGHRVHGTSMGVSQIAGELKEIIEEYAPDSTFRRDLESEDFYESRVVSRDIKYILFRYETFLRRQVKEPLDLKLPQIMSEEFEVEHIWPRNPTGLNRTQAEEHLTLRDKLGNLTIAAKAWNASWGNKPFRTKRDAVKGYKSSVFRVQRELADWDARDWRGQQVEDRGRKIADFCLREWAL